MSTPQSISRSLFSKLSIISLSSFDTISSIDNHQCIPYHHNNNHSTTVFNEKKSININAFDQAIDQAVVHFEQILAQCVTPSTTSLIQDDEQQQHKNDTGSRIEAKKRDCQDFLRSLNKQKTMKTNQREHKINCRKWCEEQNRRIEKSHPQIGNNTMKNDDNTYRSYNQNRRGSTFYCRKSLLQKCDGVTYICIRKRLD